MSGFAPAGELFSGEAMAEPDKTDASQEFIAPNLTPDPETGIIARWNEYAFVKRFREAGRVHAGSKMPYANPASLSESDLRSLYQYLMSLKPVRHVTGPSRRGTGWKPGS